MLFVIVTRRINGFRHATSPCVVGFMIFQVNVVTVYIPEESENLPPVKVLRYVNCLNLLQYLDVLGANLSSRTNFDGPW